MKERESPSASPRCACRKLCGDVPEREDKPLAVCKGLRPAPGEECVQVVLRESTRFDLWPETGHFSTEPKH